MQDNIILNETEINKNQILITGITWNKNTIYAYATKKTNDELPSQFTLDIPENVLNQANKKTNNFNNVIETFVYNFLTKKYGHEVYSCSIWLPLEK